MRTHVAILFCAALLASCFAAEGVAQEWPTRPVKLYIPFGPGSTPDMVGRLIADRLAQKLGQPFVVEDKPGASGNLGTDAVAKAEPDGYTLGLSIAGPLAINALLFGKLPYDPGKDLAYVTSQEPGHFALANHINPIAFLQLAHHVRVYRHAANLLNIAARYRLAIRNNGQRFHHRAAIFRLAFRA